jgi:hypothetical protein
MTDPDIVTKLRKGRTRNKWKESSEMESLHFSVNIHRRDVGQEDGKSFNPCNRNSARARTSDHANDDHDKDYRRKEQSHRKINTFAECQV